MDELQSYVTSMFFEDQCKVFKIRASDFRCWCCKEVPNCPYAFDFYNLNGACLAEK